MKLKLMILFLASLGVGQTFASDAAGVHIQCESKDKKSELEADLSVDKKELSDIRYLVEGVQVPEVFGTSRAINILDGNVIVLHHFVIKSVLEGKWTQRHIEFQFNNFFNLKHFTAMIRVAHYFPAQEDPGYYLDYKYALSCTQTKIP